MWDYLLQREVVVTLAVVGAATATVGSWLRYRGTAPVAGRTLYWAGYAITGLSVAFFILAGLWGVGP